MLFTHITKNSLSYDEVLIALKLANRAKLIKNKPTLSLLSDSESILEFQSELSKDELDEAQEEQKMLSLDVQSPIAQDEPANHGSMTIEHEQKLADEDLSANDEKDIGEEDTPDAMTVSPQ